MAIQGRLLVLAALAASVEVASAAAPQRPADDWPAYNRTLAADRYSPLAQINASNVGQLALRCAFTLPEVVSFQTGPLVIDGTMYFTTYEGSYAIDAASCKEKWSRHDKSTGPPGLAVNRGFAYLDGRLYRGTADAHVIALDAADGQLLWDRALPVKGPGHLHSHGADRREWPDVRWQCRRRYRWRHRACLRARCPRRACHLAFRCGAGARTRARHLDQSPTADIRRRILDLLHVSIRPRAFCMFRPAIRPLTSIRSIAPARTSMPTQ